MQSFFKTPKNNSFQYIPRFYDERKEELEDFRNQYDEEQDPERIKERVIRKMRSRYYSRGKYAKKANRKSGAMVFLIALILLALAVLVLVGYPELTNI
ncbi:MAG: hypothetical protein EA409_08710 [Saprospirales bacterium]|nr:MAG: hypothetical protein EA409_08710 [Saprospirales bacterium]